MEGTLRTMKKVLIALVIILLILLGVIGFITRDKVMSIVNEKLGGNKKSIEISIDASKIPTLTSYLESIRGTLDKKSYKVFKKTLDNTLNETMDLAEEIIPDYKSNDNYMFIEADGVMYIDFINCNMYNSKLQASYHALQWVEKAPDDYADWPGFFVSIDTVFDSMKNDLDAEETEAEAEQVDEESSEPTLSEEDKQAIMQFYGSGDIIAEDALVSSLSGSFGDKYSIVENLMNTAKTNLMNDDIAKQMLGESSFGVGFGGVIENNSKYYLLVGKLNEDSSLGTENYVLFTIDTSGNYDDYSEGIKLYARSSNVPLPDVTLPSGGETATSEEETLTPRESVAETTDIMHGVSVDSDMVETTSAESTEPETQPETAEERPVVSNRSSDDTPKNQPKDLFDGMEKETTHD